MSRPDLDMLRAQILDTFYLTRAEVGSLRYWHEDKLRDTLAFFEAITEAEQEFDDEIADEVSESREVYEFPVEEYDDEFWYEYEAVIDYGND